MKTTGSIHFDSNQNSKTLNFLQTEINKYNEHKAWYDYTLDKNITFSDINIINKTKKTNKFKAINQQ
jgi:hypothetical protein